MNQNYLREFERWTAGPPERRAAISAEFAEHLTEAEAAGELGSTLDRLGPPRDAAKAFAAGRELHPSPLGRRVVAFVLDVAIPAVTAFAIIALATALGVGDGSEALVEFGRDVAAERSSEWGSLQAVAVLSLGAAWLWWIVGIPVSEWRYGRTPGKAAMGLRVVSEEGIALSFGQAVVRNLTRVFSGPLQLIDWGWALFDDRRQRAVEKLAHTLVIRDEPREAPVRAATRAPVGNGAS